MNITETTYGIYGIHSRKLDAAALPQDFTDRMLTAAFHLAWLIGNGEVTASDDGNAEAEDALDTLSGLAEEAMQRFGTPCAADPTFSRRYPPLRLVTEPCFNEEH